MAQRKLTLIFQIILFIGFMFFGIAKFLVSPEQAADVFGKIGGTPMQYFTGAYQVISAILVIIPSTAFIGALMIVVSMAVAILLHLTILGFAGPFLVMTLIAVILLLIALYVMKHRRKDLFSKK